LLSQEETEEINSLITKVREVIDKGPASEIKTRTEQLMQTRMKIFEKVYKKKMEQQSRAGAQSGTKGENKSNTTDAEYEDNSKK